MYYFSIYNVLNLKNLKFITKNPIINIYNTNFIKNIFYKLIKLFWLNYKLNIYKTKFYINK